MFISKEDIVKELRELIDVLRDKNENDIDFNLVEIYLEDITLGINLLKNKQVIL